MFFEKVRLTPKGRQLVKRLYPEYRGRKYYLTATDRPVSLNSHWDNGHRDYIKVVSSDGKVKSVPQTGTPFDGPLSRPPELTLDSDTVLVIHTYSGTSQYIHFKIHPDLMPKMLPLLEP